MKPHIHAHIIKAWAEGQEIQYQWDGGWCDWGRTCAPEFNPLKNYRIKPEKPEIKIDTKLVYLNLRFTIERDGPMANIIDVEMVK